ncbi:hypothetical protein ABK040_002765 [Willaertia magna]
MLSPVTITNNDDNNKDTQPSTDDHTEINNNKNNNNQTLSKINKILTELEEETLHKNLTQEQLELEKKEQEQLYEEIFGVPLSQDHSNDDDDDNEFDNDKNEFNEEDDDFEEENLFAEEKPKKQNGAKKIRKKEKVYQTLTRPNYHDLNLYNHEMLLLAKIDVRKFNWYLKKGLAKQINETSIQLNFKAKGDGHSNDEFYLSKIENQCVACGEVNDLTRHHVIPYEYRKFMPEFIRSNSSHDICLLCHRCHEFYEIHAIKLKNDISIEFNAPVHGIGRIVNSDFIKIKKTVGAILKNRDKIPENRLKEMYQLINNYLNRKDEDFEVTDEDLNELMNLESFNEENFKSHGELVVNEMKRRSNGDDEVFIDLLEEFTIRWRKHFVEHLRPSFMNKFWDVNKKLRRQPGQ